jgi:hypothetical protein
MKKSEAIEQIKLIVLEISKNYDLNCIKIEINCNATKQLVKFNITEYIEK